MREISSTKRRESEVSAHMVHYRGSLCGQGKDLEAVSPRLYGGQPYTSQGTKEILPLENDPGLHSRDLEPAETQQILWPGLL